MYQLFYELAIVTGALVMIIEGRRRHFGADRWVFAVGAWILGGMLGAELPRVIIGDAAAVRTAVGAVAGATLALVGAAILLRISVGEALDTTAIAIPIAGAFARLGCFAGECCQGIATSLPIGIADREGVTRHPTQLYEAAFDVAIATWLSRSRRRLEDGQRFLLSLGAMSAGRFVIEFVRDSEKIGPLSLAQWVVGPFAIACFAAVASDVRFPRARGAAASPLATAGLAAMLLQMPTLPTDSLPQRYSFWGIGIGGGLYTVHSVDERNCDSGPFNGWDRSHSYLGGSIEGGYLRQGSRWSGMAIRGRAQTSQDNAGQAVTTLGTGSPNPAPYSTRNMAAGVFADFIGHYGALTIGGSVGRIRLTGVALIDDSHNDPGTVMAGFPAIGIRLGPLHGPSLEARFGDETPLNAPMPIMTFAVAGGDDKGNRVRLGVSDAGAFIGGSFRTEHGLDLMPSFYFVPGAGQKHGAGGMAVRQWTKLPPK